MDQTDNDKLRQKAAAGELTDAEASKLTNIQRNEVAAARTGQRCDAQTLNDDRCKRVARVDAYHPRAPRASENFTMRLCRPHWKSYAPLGWLPWPPKALVQ